MKTLDTEGGIVIPSDDHKLYQKGVTTPTVQTVIFAAGAWIVYLTLAFGVLGMPALDGLTGSVVTFGFILGFGLMLRMAGPSIRVTIAGWAANRRDAQIEVLEGQVAFLQAQLRESGTRPMPTDAMHVMRCARRMIDLELHRMAEVAAGNKRAGGGWARDKFLAATSGAFSDSDWENARQILEGAGIRDPKGRHAILVTTREQGYAALAEFATRSQGHFERTATGGFVRTA